MLQVGLKLTILEKMHNMLKNDSEIPNRGYTPRDIDHPDYFGDFSWAKVIGLGCVFLFLIFIIGVLF